MPFTVKEATSNDAAAIAKIFISDEAGEFLRLQLGTVPPSRLHEGITERILQGMEKKNQIYIVARDQDTDEVVSYAKWVLPAQNVVETSEEKDGKLDEYRKKLLPGMNEPLILDLKTGLDDLRERVLQGKKHYLLGNIGTIPWYKRRGAASALTRWPFERADNEHLQVYLETDEAGNARRMYEKLGFERKDAITFDLSKYGSNGTHTQIVMVREPQSTD